MPEPICAQASQAISAALPIDWFPGGCAALRLVGVGVFFSLLLSCSVGNAKPDLQGFLPRSIQLKTSTEVIAEGKFPEWPVMVWCHRPGLKFDLQDKGKVSVKATSEALPGVYLIRFLDSTGASDVVPLIVDSLPSRVETEPNGSPSEANEIAENGGNISGVLAKSGDVDCFRLSCQKGDVLYAGVRAHPLFGTAMDGIVQICDSRGFVLNQNDDRLGVDPTAWVEIPEQGTYLIRVFAFPATPNSTVRFAGGADYRYLLTVTTGSVLRMVFPLSDKLEKSPWQPLGPVGLGDQEARRYELDEKTVLFAGPDLAGFFALDKSPPEATPFIESKTLPPTGLKLPFDYSGSISEPRQIDWIPFEAKKGQKVRFQVDARKFGLELDPTLAVYDAQGKKLAAKDDNAKTDPDLEWDFSPPANGRYYLQVTDAAGGGGPDYFYRIRAEVVRPSFQMKLAQTSFVTDVKKPLEIEVSIERKDGFQLPLEVSIEGLPDQVKVESVRSEAKGDSAKSVKLKIVADAPLQASFRVVTRLWDRAYYAEHELSSGYRVKAAWMTAIQPADSSKKEK